MKKLKNLGIKRIIDLRSVGEVEHHPNMVIDGIENINLPGGLAFTQDELNEMSENEILNILEVANEELITQTFKDIKHIFKFIIGTYASSFLAHLERIELGLQHY